MIKHLMLALALMVAIPVIAAEPERRPYSCRLFDDEQRKCAFGPCDKRVVDRLKMNACAMEDGRERSTRRAYSPQLNLRRQGAYIHRCPERAKSVPRTLIPQWLSPS
jgi:hypothetical protein